MTQVRSQLTLRENLLGYAGHIRLLWATAPSWSTVCLVATVMAASSGILVIVAIGQLVTSLGTALSTNGASEAFWTWFTLFAMATILGQIANAAVA